MDDLGIKVLISFAISLITSLITVNLSLKRFRREKIWERKLDAYTKFIELFNVSKSWTDKNYYAQKDGKEISESVDKDLREQNSEAHKEIDKYADLGTFIFSEDFSKKIRCYQSDSAVVTATNIYWCEYIQADYNLMERYLGEFTLLAKNDLKKL
jgi:hypothetical protein